MASNGVRPVVLSDGYPVVGTNSNDEFIKGVFYEFRSIGVILLDEF